MLYVGGREVIDGTLSLGDFTIFYTYLLMLMGPMRMLGMSLGMAQRAVASGNRMFEILDREPRITSEPGAPPLPDGPGAVSFRDVGLRYGDDEPALERHRPRGAGRADRRAGRSDRLGQDQPRRR